jgi:ATP-dependent protease ClpP protease subunit
LILTTPTPTSLELDAALVIRAQAETEKFRAEAAAALADGKVKEAEARKKLAEAKAEEYRSENSRVNMEMTLRQEQFNLAANHYHHEFHFNYGVTDESVEACVAQMAVWHRQDTACPIKIVIDSPGGSVIDGMHLFDEISAYSLREWDDRELPKGTHETTMVVRGYAASMAGILLQSADKRIIGPEAFLMIHEISTFARGKIGEIKDEVKFLDKISERVVNLFVTRSGGKISREDFKKQWDRQDWWLTSEESLKFGFVDQIG